MYGGTKDLIPAIGEVDAFLKIPQPDGKNSDLGLAQLDEPCLRLVERSTRGCQSIILDVYIYI